MSRLVVRDAHWAQQGRAIVAGASFALQAGELVALLGPNGAGKTSLVRIALGLLPGATGAVAIDDQPIGQLDASARARRIAYLPQQRPLAWPQRVRDVVALGRFAHGVALGRLGPTDAEAVDRALLACDVAGLADRAADTLSGGEMARVHLARALAADAPLILADEPIAALDPRHQHDVMALFRGFADRGGGALVVLHDLALAARYADRLIWMKDGRIVADGPTAETLTPARIADVYGVRARIAGGGAETDVHIDGPA